ncbi:hypothetical protein N7486_001068 [Penicillium sp. IBT 16267x]|nr:hypothetical protein N7486_001068 [Penicillium sp. IBT 16267x]
MKMFAVVYLLLTSVYIRVAFGGALQVIDYDNQCVMWSQDIYGCTGYSAPFALLNGDDCSELSEDVNGTRTDFSVLSVDACGIENGLPAAWI